MSQRVRLSGPPVHLESKAALALSMIIHELATNALKHGALSGETGSVEISWELVADQRVSLLWRERDGPVPMPLTRRGFGSRLIQRAMPAELDPSVEFDLSPAGLVFRLAFETREDRSKTPQAA
jgi:two-component sensor histidine kinase